MSYTISTNTYAGEVAAGYVAKALLENKTIEGNYVNLITSVGSKYVIPTFDVSNLVQLATCDFTDAGTITLSENLLTVDDFQVNKAVCKKDLLAWFTAAKQKAGALNRDVPADLNEFTIDYFSKFTKQVVEEMIWQGDSAGATSTYLDWMDGLVKRITASTGEIAVVGTTLSASNILTELGKVYAAIPAAKRSTAKIYFSPAAEAFFVQAYMATYNGNYNDKAKLQYGGIELVTVPIATNKMVAADPNDLYVGTDLASDLNEVAVIDMAKTDGSQNVRYIMRFHLGTQVANPTQIVIYA